MCSLTVATMLDILLSKMNSPRSIKVYITNLSAVNHFPTCADALENPTFPAPGDWNAATASCGLLCPRYRPQCHVDPCCSGLCKTGGRGRSDFRSRQSRHRYPEQNVSWVGWKVRQVRGQDVGRCVRTKEGHHLRQKRHQSQHTVRLPLPGSRALETYSVYLGCGSETPPAAYPGFVEIITPPWWVW